MKWEAAAKLVAGPVGSIWKLTLHTRRARSVFGFAHATSRSPPFHGVLCRPQDGAGYIAIENRKSKIENEEAERIGIEPTSPLARRRRF